MGRSPGRRVATVGASGSAAENAHRRDIRSTGLMVRKLIDRAEPGSGSQALQRLLENGTWRSLAAHLLWEQGVAGSNPAVPTSGSGLAGSSRA